jgi:hypothetical protein
MKRRLLAVVGIAVLVVTATAGNPRFNSDSFTVDGPRMVGRGLWEYKVTRTATFASAAIDTVFVDVKDLYQGLSGAAATGAIEINMFFGNLASGDSLSVQMLPAMVEYEPLALGGAATGIAAFVVTGGTAALQTFEKAVASAPVRFHRYIITNNQHASQAAIDYSMTIQAQRCP